MMTARDGHGDGMPRVAHEMSDVSAGGIFIFALGLMVTILVVHLLLWMMFAFLAREESGRTIRQYPLAATQQNRLPPSPRLQVNPREELRGLRSQEDAVLSSYGWVDRESGVARIPIDEAMRLTVQRGLPVRQKP
jgi:hypothetical protein